MLITVFSQNLSEWNAWKGRMDGCTTHGMLRKQKNIEYRNGGEL